MAPYARDRGRALALAVAIGASIAGAQPAMAATLTAFPQPTYTAAAGEQNFVGVTGALVFPMTPPPFPFPPGPPPPPMPPARSGGLAQPDTTAVVIDRIDGAGATISDGDGAGTGCESRDGAFTCPLPAGATVQVTLGDQRDLLVMGAFFAVQVSVEGGSGGDRIVGGVAPDVLLGEDDDDSITGWGGVDHLSGGAGDDVLSGDGEEDRPHDEPGGDRVDGGPGDDRLHGREGDDELIGDAGHDHVIGGPGADNLTAGPGNDLIESIDGAPDAVSCGDGADAVRADAADAVAGDCEAVSASLPAMADLQRDLRSDLRSATRELRGVSARALARRQAIAHPFTPLTSGILSVTWYRSGPGGAILARAVVDAIGVNPLVVGVEPTRAAKRRLRRARRVRITAIAYFRPGGDVYGVRATSRFTARRQPARAGSACWRPGRGCRAPARTG